MKFEQTISIVASLLLLTSSLFSSGWIYDKDGCKHYNPVPSENETVTWSGSCKNGYADGYGTLIWYQNNKKGTTQKGSKSKGKFYEKDLSDSDKATMVVAGAVVVGALSWLFGGGDNDSSSSSSSSYSSSDSSNISEKYYECKFWCRTSGLMGKRKDAGTATVKALPGMEYEPLYSKCEALFGSEWYLSSHDCEEM